MSYADFTALQARYTRAEIALWLGLDPSDDDAEFEAALAPAISDIAAEIDGYLRGRTSLPVDPVPDRLVAVAADLTREAALEGRGARLDGDSAERRAADRARATLKSYIRGELDLGLPAPGTSASPQASDSGARAFTRDTLRDY